MKSIVTSSYPAMHGNPANSSSLGPSLPRRVRPIIKRVRPNKPKSRWWFAATSAANLRLLRNSLALWSKITIRKAAWYFENHGRSAPAARAGETWLRGNAWGNEKARRGGGMGYRVPV